MDQGIGQLGLMPDEFWDLSFKELSLLSKHKSEEVKRDWDIARNIGAWSLQPWSKKKIKPDDLLKFGKKVRRSTFEEFQEAVGRLNGKS